MEYNIISVRRCATMVGLLLCGRMMPLHCKQASHSLLGWSSAGSFRVRGAYVPSIVFRYAAKKAGSGVGEGDQERGDGPSTGAMVAASLFGIGTPVRGAGPPVQVALLTEMEIEAINVRYVSFLCMKGGNIRATWRLGRRTLWA